MSDKTRGIVLNSINYSDNSIIVRIYTESFGMVSYIVPGVKKSAKRKMAVFQPLSLLELVVSHNEKNSLQRIKEVQLAHAHTSLPFNPVKSSIAIFISELLFKSLQEESSNKEIFEFVFNSIIYLDLHPLIAHFHLVFALKLTKYLGFYPENIFSDAHPNFHLLEGRFVSQNDDIKHILSKEQSRAFSKLLESEKIVDDKLFLKPSEKKTALAKYSKLLPTSFALVSGIQVS